MKDEIFSQEFKPVKLKSSVSYYDKSSTFPDEDVGYHWLDYSYPFFHTHDFFEFLIVTEGSINHMINGESVTMNKSDMCFIRPEDHHAIFNITNPCRHLDFTVKYEYAKNILDSYDTSLFDKIVNNKESLNFQLPPSELQKIVNTVLSIRSQKIEKQKKVFNCKIIVNSLFNFVIDNMFSYVKNFPDWFTDFLFVLSNPYIYNTDVKNLATFTPYSYSRLSTLFKEKTGRTIIEYITNVKMKCAQELLKASDLSVKEIAIKLNYDSISHFVRTFKKEYNITPIEYRKLHYIN